MKQILFTASLLCITQFAFSQNNAGNFGLGTRNTVSLFNDDEKAGTGIVGQFRIQFSDRVNSEWYFDYITSKNQPYTFRNDYHIGWSVMLYPKNNFDFDHLLQPYIIVGHCFDYSKVIALKDKSNAADRLSMATQAGVGTHININSKLDCSFSGQYMLHFGEELETSVDEGSVVIEKLPNTHPDGHLLFTVSFNYKFFKLWNN